jgi:hypothetical protein
MIAVVMRCLTCKKLVIGGRMIPHMAHNDSNSMNTFNDLQGASDKIAHSLMNWEEWMSLGSIKFNPTHGAHIHWSIDAFITGIRGSLTRLDIQDDYTLRDMIDNTSLTGERLVGYFGIVIGTDDFPGHFIVWVNETTYVTTLQYYPSDNDVDD